MSCSNFSDLLHVQLREYNRRRRRRSQPLLLSKHRCLQYHSRVLVQAKPTPQ